MKKNYIPWLVGAAAVLIAVCIGIYFLNRPKSAAPRISKTEQARRDSISLKVALMPTFACLPFYYADDTGIYDSLGLDVKMLTFQAQMDCDTALARGHVECSYTDVIRAARLQNRGTGLYVFMQADENWQLITAKEKRIKRTNQLKEQMVAIARFSATDYMTDAILEHAKVSDADVYRPQVNDVKLRAAMLCNGELDAIISPEPYASKAKKRGHRAIFNQDSLKVQLAAMAVNYTARHDSSRVREIELLIRGYNVAVERLNKLTKASQIGKTARIFDLDADVLNTLKLPHYNRAILPDGKAVNVAVNFLKSRNQLQEKYDGDTLLTTKFLRP